jgi:DNA-directed RNA polymerase subunit RPC12/RpoP
MPWRGTVGIDLIPSDSDLGHLVLVVRSPSQTIQGDYLCFRCGDQVLRARDRPRPAWLRSLLAVLGFDPQWKRLSRIPNELRWTAYVCPRCRRLFGTRKLDAPRLHYESPIFYAVYVAQFGTPGGGIKGAVSHFRDAAVDGPSQFSPRILLEDLAGVLADSDAISPGSSFHFRRETRGKELRDFLQVLRDILEERRALEDLPVFEPGWTLAGGWTWRSAGKAHAESSGLQD